MNDLPTLMEAMCQGTATHADRDRLEAILRDPVARARYLAAARLHAELLWRWHRGQVGATRANGRGGSAAGAAASRLRVPARGSAARDGGRFAAAVAAARDAAVGWLRFLGRPTPLACLVAAAMLGSFITAATILHVGRHGDRAFAAVARVTPPLVARVAGFHDVRWSSSRHAWRDWDALPSGARIDVAAGLVRIAHNDGATIVIEGPASYQVLGAAEGRLIHGRITVRTEHAAPTGRPDRPAQEPTPLFTVRTPTRFVHDLGTEFGVHVAESGESGVHVFEGLVELAAVDRGDADEVPVRLGAGDSAGIDEAGRIATGVASLARTFVRSLPEVNTPKSFLEQVGWSDAAAEVINRDAFTGAGPLAGTTPESRGGVGAAAWAAPADWTLSPADGAAMAASQGTALLPFTPEPGWLYRISIDLDVFAGGGDWFVMGLAPAMGPADVISSVAGAHAWMGQRHETHHSGLVGNFAFAGPGHSGLVMPIDMATGRLRRSILLDTRGRGWAAYFLRGDEPVARCTYPVPPGSLACVALSQLGLARTRLHGFTVARIAAAAAPAAGVHDEEARR